MQLETLANVFLSRYNILVQFVTHLENMGNLNVFVCESHHLFSKNNMKIGVKEMWFDGKQQAVDLVVDNNRLSRDVGLLYCMSQTQSSSLLLSEFMSAQVVNEDQVNNDYTLITKGSSDESDPNISFSIVAEKKSDQSIAYVECIVFIEDDSSLTTKCSKILLNGREEDISTVNLQSAIQSLKSSNNILIAVISQHVDSIEQLDNTKCTLLAILSIEATLSDPLKCMIDHLQRRNIQFIPLFPQLDASQLVFTEFQLATIALQNYNLYIPGDFEHLDICELSKYGTVMYSANPTNKLNFVKLLQSCNKTVAYYGNSLADSPSLLQSDIGVCNTTSPDAVKEQCSMVLLDNELQSFFKAMEYAVLNLNKKSSVCTLL